MQNKISFEQCWQQTTFEQCCSHLFPSTLIIICTVYKYRCGCTLDIVAVVLYTASKNYMQIGFFVILYRFLNQCFGNLAPGIVTFVSAYMQNFMPISATINKR